MKPVISIDFGAAYTKIAVRRKLDSRSCLLTHESLNLDEQHVCIPSIAALRETDGRWLFGVDAVDLSDGNGIYVFKNWKPQLFGSYDEARYSVEQVEDAAVEYFRWIRNGLLPSMLGDEASSAHLRVCVPDFTVNTRASSRFDQLLAKAGWNSEVSFCISEPFANMTGAMSQGYNSVTTDAAGTPVPDLREIFSESEYVNYFKGSKAGEERRYVVLIIDIGAYTTDLAVVHIGPDAEAYAPMCGTHSIPMGVIKLDDMVKEALPAKKRFAIEELSATDRERLRQMVYSRGMMWYVTPDMLVGEGDEFDKINGCVSEFANQIGDAVDKFLEDNETASIQEVVLSGGGNNIPTVVDILGKRLAKRKVLAFHAAVEEAMFESARTIPLNQLVHRGASALGGASVIFDHQLRN